jgi:hypothetical protein
MKRILLRYVGALCVAGIFLLPHVASASVITIIDNGDGDYSTTGTWSTWPSSGTQGDFDYKVVGDGATASWTLSGQTPGLYRVSVNWEAFTNRAVDAPYSVLDGATTLDTVIIDQTQAPNDFTEGGVLWEDLGVYTLTGDTLTVRLSDLANPLGNYVMIADAVRFERLSAIPIPAAVWLFGSGLLGLVGMARRKKAT